MPCFCRDTDHLYQLRQKYPNYRKSERQKHTLCLGISASEAAESGTLNLCFMSRSVFQWFRRSRRLHLYSAQVPIAIVDDENIISHIYLWNSCIPSPNKKLRHNS